MNETPYRIAYLVAGYIRNTLSEQEQDELDNWVNESDENLQLFEDLTDEAAIKENLHWMDQVQTEQSFTALKEKGAFTTRKKKRALPNSWLAAASILLVISLFFLVRYSSQDPRPPALTTLENQLLQPGGNKATLTLEDGAVIDLGSAVNGPIAFGKGSHVRKPADGELVYETKAFANRTTSVHTLSTPVGGQYQLQLPDGTKVWLNASSQLRYPTAFSKGERIVNLQGEAYFEVAPNKEAAFKVLLANGAFVQVLGTRFNLFSYPEETAQEITLLEGQVRVTKEKQSVLLLPGQQALLTPAGIDTPTQVDTATAIAWKNGVFEFKDAGIETIMKQVERWYGATIIYEGEVNQLFNASILRSEPLTKLLHLLELTGQVNFKIDKKTIYVLPR